MELDLNTVAKEAANALVEDLNEPQLPAEVDKILTNGVSQKADLDGNTVISLAALTIAAAQLAWAIHSDLTGKGSKTKVEIEDELGHRLKIQTNAPPEKINKIVKQVTKSLFSKQQ